MTPVSIWYRFCAAVRRGHHPALAFDEDEMERVRLRALANEWDWESWVALTVEMAFFIGRQLFTDVWETERAR